MNIKVADMLLLLLFSLYFFYQQCDKHKALGTFFKHVSYHSTVIKAVIDASCTTTTEATADISHIFNLSQVS